ncbi:MAG: alpha/beta hydrolase [Bacteroidetes bacterium]|nr:MAG: alpha/beta hydrolase [Bacteroidota bacterium]
MNLKFCISSALLCFSFGIICIAQQLPKQLDVKEFSIGKTLVIESEILKEERTLNIYLPASYIEDSTKNYPVIYLLDGSRDEDFIHVSGLVQFCSFSWINILPETIVVGIGNVDRQRDFTYPSRNKEDQKELPSSGKSADFIRFIQEELQTFVESNFRTQKRKTLIGQSLGGLLATEILFKNPNLFDNYLIVSPSLWWDNEALLKQVPREYQSKKSIYIAVGKEGPVMERTARELYDQLKLKKGQNTELFFEFLENKSHGDALHETVYHGFEKIFSESKEK